MSEHVWGMEMTDGLRDKTTDLSKRNSSWLNFHWSSVWLILFMIFYIISKQCVFLNHQMLTSMFTGFLASYSPLSIYWKQVFNLLLCDTFIDCWQSQFVLFLNLGIVHIKRWHIHCEDTPIITHTWECIPFIVIKQIPPQPPLNSVSFSLSRLFPLYYVRDRQLWSVSTDHGIV